uniref:Uncharacterized protein n=1 Tax=Oryza rufipogon TaxID=4529 RepID=A0A0E0N0D0_ORYRU
MKDDRRGHADKQLSKGLLVLDGVQPAPKIEQYADCGSNFKVSLFLAAASGSAPCTSPQRSPESGRTFLWRDHSFAPAPMLNAPSKIALCFMIAIFQQLVWWLPMAMDILSHYCAVRTIDFTLAVNGGEEAQIVCGVTSLLVKVNWSLMSPVIDLK